MNLGIVKGIAMLSQRLCLLASTALIALLLFALVPNSVAHAGGVIYVVPGGMGSHSGSNWADAKDFQEALSTAASGDEIWVKAGTYTPSSAGDPYATFTLKSGVAIYGGFAGNEQSRSERDSVANRTIFSGDIGSNDRANPATTANDIVGTNSYHVFYLSNVDSTALLDGATITAGSAEWGGFPQDRGAGMFMTDSSPLLSNLVFSGNAGSYGGAIVTVASRPTLTSVLFSGNRAVVNGGAMYSHISSALTLTNVTFSGNSAGASGGGLIITSNPNVASTLSNVVFSGNVAGEFGGGMTTNASTVTITNATFSGNRAPRGGALNSGSAVVVHNSILWNDGGGEISYDVNSAPAVAFSLVQGGYSGPSNRSADPRFLVPINPALAPTTIGNLRLASQSPAIDAGSNNLVVGVADRDGRARVVGPSVDIGAYEQQMHLLGAPPSGVYGSLYSYSFRTTSAAATTYALVGSLPLGLTFNNGTIVGTPGSAGRYDNIQVSATNADGSDTQVYAIEISKAPLTVRADDKTRAVGAPNPPLTVSYSGFVASDTAAVLVGAPILSTSATLSSTVGQYPIIVAAGGLQASNYHFLFVNGTLTIQPRPSTSPVGVSLTINGGALTSTSLAVIITSVVTDAEDGPEDLEMGLSNDGISWSDWRPYAQRTSWRLAIGDGEKHVYGRFRDSVGKLSNQISDTIALDTIVQAEYSLSINSAALYTNRVDVELTISAQPGASEMQLSNDGGFASATWQPYASHKAWQITRYGNYVTPRIVYVRFRDGNGTTTATYQDDILLDVTPPKGRIRIAAVGATRAAASTLLELDASDDLSGVGAMRLSERSDFSNAAWEPFATTRSWVASGSAIVYVQFRDNAGNVSETYALQLDGTYTVLLPLVQR